MSFSSPTKRQQLLLDRLITLGEWAASGRLPVKVLEIKGFGSFFRGKTKPKDVDLVLRVQHPEHTSEFERFLRLVSLIRRQQTSESESPREALLRAYHDEERELPHSGIEGGCDLFGEWIEGYSWNMLTPKSMFEELDLKSPQSYTKRMVRRLLPNLNVFSYEVPCSELRPAGLRCGFIVSLWSEEEPDVRANLETLLADDTVSENARRELAYFRVHHPQIAAKADLVGAGIEHLKGIARRPSVGDWRWSEDWSDSCEDLSEWRTRFSNAEAALARFDEEQWGAGIPPQCDVAVMDLADVMSETERLREEIRELYDQVELLESLRECLFQFKLSGERTKLSAEEFVVSEMLGRGSARKRKRVAQFLAEMGFPQAAGH